MSKIFKFLLLVVVLIAAAYVAGFWPQRQRVTTLETENASLQQRLAAAEARVRAGALLGELLTLKEVVQEMNYGQARGLSSPFFEHVSTEAGQATDPGVKQALAAILQRRDAMTVALTQGDATALAHLREAEAHLRRALGYPAPIAAAATTQPFGASPAPANTYAPNPYGAPSAPSLGGASPTPDPGLPGAAPTLPTPLPSP